jgi:hypothetical protein
MVTPPALMAAIPVGATTMCFLRVFLTKLFRKVVLPVPAFPVRKIFRGVFYEVKKLLFILGSKIVKKNQDVMI